MPFKPFEEVVNNPGKYDDLCTEVREKSNAKLGAAIIVLEGDKGSGVSLQVRESAIGMLPDFLRRMADELEKDNAERAKRELGGTKHTLAS